jgi:hypothetical protein
LEQSEILEPLHTCLREVLQLDKDGKSSQIEYTDDDVLAASLMLAHVLGNRLMHRLVEERASIGLSRHLATTYGESIAVIAKQMSGVDINVMHKDTE